MAVLEIIDMGAIKKLTVYYRQRLVSFSLAQAEFSVQELESLWYMANDATRQR